MANEIEKIKVELPDAGLVDLADRINSAGYCESWGQVLDSNV